MAFPETTQKCIACDKPAYEFEKLSVDNRVYHEACFKCHHCNRTLKLSNFISYKGVIYCKPHYDQTVKRCGGIIKSEGGTSKLAKPEKPTELIREKGNLSNREGDKEKNATPEKIDD